MLKIGGLGAVIAVAAKAIGGLFPELAPRLGAVDAEAADRGHAIANMVSTVRKDIPAD
jgi:hypothetical protein